MKKVFIFILLMLTAACSKESDTENKNNRLELSKSSAVTYSFNGQEFQIIPYYEQYWDYIEAQKTDTGNINESFLLHVLNPLSTEIYGYNHGFTLDDPHFYPPRNMEKLQTYIQRLDQDHDKIVQAVKDAIDDSVPILPGGDFQIYIIPSNPEKSLAYMNGVAGFATTKDAMVMQIDPNEYTEESIKTFFAHEYHHLVFMDISDYRISKPQLLDIMMMEGKADAFTSIVYEDYYVGWIEPLDDEEEQNVKRFLQEKQTSYDHKDYSIMHNGNAPLGIPQWSHYRLGYQIMQQFISKHPEMSVEDWTRLETEKIMEGSGVSLRE
ncbi:uncharacterized protein YjaZ [Bacillus tianshenii]|uniref:Uncharacterized protein YjaZ n=1 Tax=Sutcliffiella tianshenii TaxID=1463404 RepID=A0ABS2P2N9_9BACI|nr:DUF2268 domain-containing putative Zn-dependent protease [Bacillus tianshenii]MBM7621221.1 uncharacterized protein YjaZ [Bacillus tianshenii]